MKIKILLLAGHKPGHFSTFPSTRTGQGQASQNQDCPGQTRTLGNYVTGDDPWQTHPHEELEGKLTITKASTHLVQ